MKLFFFFLSNMSELKFLLKKMNFLFLEENKSTQHSIDIGSQIRILQLTELLNQTTQTNNWSNQSVDTNWSIVIRSGSFSTATNPKLLAFLHLQDVNTEARPRLITLTWERVINILAATVYVGTQNPQARRSLRQTSLHNSTFTNCNPQYLNV